MAIEVKCPNCQALLRIADENVGRKSRCPNCTHVFTAQSSTPPSSSQSPPPVPSPNEPTRSPFVDPLSDVASRESSWGGGPPQERNPYAPTFTETQQPLDSGAFAPRRITLDEVMTKSWSIFKKQWTMVCVAVLIVGAVNFGANMFQNVLVQGVAMAIQEQAVVVGVQFLTSALFWVLGIWLQLGQTIVMLDIARGRPVNFSRLFSAGPYLLNGVLAMLLVGLVLLVIAGVLVGIPAGVGLAIAQSGEGAAVGAGIGVFLALVPIVVVSLAVSQIQPLIVDRGLGPVNSLRVSYEITNGNKFTLLLIGVVLMAVTLLAAIVGLLMLCIGLIPAMIAAGAFSALVFAVAYLLMTGQGVVVPETTGSTNSTPPLQPTVS